MSVRLKFAAVAATALLSGCAGWPAGDFLNDQIAIAGPDVTVQEMRPEGPVADGYPVPVVPAVAVQTNSSWGEPAMVPSDLVGPKAVADTDGPYLLDTGDKLRIFVYGQPNLSRLYTVDHDGKIAVPLIGEINARAKTTRQLQSTIRARLGAEFVKDPQVTVDVQQNRPFFILGEIRNAGQYPYVSGMTVETAIAIAGGYTERASERKFRITRRINGFVEQIEAPGDYVVRPGDTIYVFERFL
jgi:polysaccharide export outer membrane protein